VTGKVRKLRESAAEKQLQAQQSVGETASAIFG